MLDTDVTPELAAEGLARDVVRVVQQARREADLNVSDRITLTVEASDDVTAAVEATETFVASETLATSVSVAPRSTAASPARPATARRYGSGSRRPDGGELLRAP